MRETYDLVIVGAGPAGMAAAIEARAHDLSVLLLDEQPAPGGQIYRGTEDGALGDPGVLGPEYGRGAELAGAFRRSGAGYLPGATVWEVTPDRWVGHEADGAAGFVRGERIMLATGAYERPFPIPGWTLPGVMTAGAAQILLKTAGAVPGPRTVLAGTGPLLYLLAWQLERAGRTVQAILDTTPRPNYARALVELPRALAGTSALAKGLRLLAGIRRAGVRHVTGITDLVADGGARVEAVSFRRGAQTERLETDLLLLHQGVVPNIQLTRALRCGHRWDPAQLGWSPVRDDWGQTTVPGVGVAGDGAAIEGALAAVHAGRLAALHAAWSLGRIDEAGRDRLAGPIRAARRRELSVRPFLDRLYRPPDRHRVPPDDATIVCRCEEVTAGEIRRCVALGAQGPNQLKAFTRCGMGPCQGRLCGLTVAELIAAARGVPPAEVGYYRLRPPIKPITLGALAATRPPGSGPEEIPGAAGRRPRLTPPTGAP